MNDPESVFRREALEFHERPPGAGPLVDLHRRWVIRLYWAVLVLLALGLAAGALIEVDDSRRLFEVLFR